MYWGADLLASEICFGFAVNFTGTAGLPTKPEQVFWLKLPPGRAFVAVRAMYSLPATAMTGASKITAAAKSTTFSFASLRQKQPDDEHGNSERLG